MKCSHTTHTHSHIQNTALLIHPCNWIRLVSLHFHRNSIICSGRMKMRRSFGSQTALVVRRHCNGSMARIVSIEERFCACADGNGQHCTFIHMRSARKHRQFHRVSEQTGIKFCMFSVQKLERVDKRNINLISSSSACFANDLTQASRAVELGRCTIEKVLNENCF